MNRPDDAVLDTVATGSYYAPHDVLGVHGDADGTWVIRARRPLAETVTAVLPNGERIAL
ncbi:hypothetical protein ACC848_39180, partial [Rhizobium johnstonii]